MLLAGEMLKSEKPTFNISPVGAFFGGGGLCASGWGNVKNLFENVASGWGNDKKCKRKLLTFPQWEGFFCKSASGWGNVKNFFENVLLAGEMLKSAKQTFNISPVGGFFLQKCFWLGKC